MLGSDQLKENIPLVDRVLTEGRRVYHFTEICTKYAPRAVLVVNVSPVSVTTPLAAGVFKKTHWYHPGRIIGSAALTQVGILSLSHTLILLLCLLHLLNISMIAHVKSTL